MTIIDIPQSISIVLAAPVPDVLTSCSLVPPTPPPAPPTSGIIYTPVAPGITYAALSTVTIVDTSPDQIIGCIHDTADNPQGRLNVLFPSAINGDGVIERRNNDIWVYNGTIWNNVGPSPGPTIQTVPTLILPYNETAIYEGRLRLGNVVTKFGYALELLTVVPAFKIDIGYTAERYQFLNVPLSSIAIATDAPVVTSSTNIRVLNTPDTLLGAPIPVISQSINLVVPSALDVLVASPLPLVGSGIGVSVAPPSVTITIAAGVPIVGSFIVRVSVTGIAVAAPVPTLA